MSATARSTLRWLAAPAVEKVPRGHAVAATAVRMLLGLMWLYNVAWKRAPDFGKDSGNGVYGYTLDAVENPVFPPYSWLVEHLILPNFQVFGWLVLSTETALAVLLLTGAWVRLAAVLGIAQSLAIALSVAATPGEWPWSYWLMIGGHVLVLFSSAGRYLAVDGVRAGLLRPRVLTQTWGAIAVLLGVVTLIGSLDDPLAAKGSEVAARQLSVSLGQYNLVGALVLVVTGVLLLASSRTSASTARVLGLAAGTVALVAALTLHVQLGFHDPWLGGSATSAAVFISLAVVAIVSTRQSNRAPADPRTSVTAGAR